MNEYVGSYNVVHDPETDLWVIMDKDGYVVEHFTFKWEAVRACRKLNNE